MKISANSAALGAVLSFAIAAALFSRFGFDARLARDEAIYAYGGQQLAEGVPYYVSIFDIKTPLASQLAGLGVLAARALGVDDLDAIRVVFFLCACGTVAAVYLLNRWLWRSWLAGFVGVAVFAAFRGFAIDAGGGPNAKTPGILFAVASMALAVRGGWFWSALAGSLAFLVWQPLAIYPALAVAAAALTASPGRRRPAVGRALAGAALPVAATVAYFWLSGALPELVEAAFTFPVTDLDRGGTTLSSRIDDIVATARGAYAAGRFLLWGGLLALVALLVARLIGGRAHLRRTLADPFVSVVCASFLVLGGYALIDFQGYPDLYPLLPYAAVGLGGAAALAAERPRAPALRRAAAIGGAIAVAALVVFSWAWYSRDADLDDGLPAQRASAAALERLVDPGQSLYALGDPAPLVFTERRNPSRFIYLSSGVGGWVKRHTAGGVTGWIANIRAAHPAVIVMHGWKSPLARQMARRLERRYDLRYLGGWKVFLAPGVEQRARQRGVVVPKRRPAPG